MTYFVEIGFAGFIGCSETYEVVADSLEEAKELALEMAMEDLTVESVNEDEE